MNTTTTNGNMNGLAMAFCAVPNGSAVGGQLCSVSETTIELRFPVRCAIPLGCVIPIRITVGGAGTTAPIAATGIRRTEQGLGQEYLFRHNTPPEQLPAFLRRVVERRKSLRYRPVRPVAVELEAQYKGIAHGTLLDVSKEGCGVAVTPETDQLFAGVAKARVRFRIDQTSFAFDVAIRRRELLDSGTLLYGVEFLLSDEVNRRTRGYLEREFASMRPQRR